MPRKGGSWRNEPVACADCAAPTLRKERCEGCSHKRQRANQDRWHRENRERSRAAVRRFKERHPDRVNKRKQVFGVTPDEFAAMLHRQGGMCDICNTTEPGGKGWNLDHDHAKSPKDRSGHRGVLCRGCNRLLGYAKDSESTLEAAIAYLKRYALGVRVKRYGASTED